MAKLCMDQAALRKYWLGAPVGRLSPWEQAKALGLREAYKELRDGEVNVAWVAARVNKVGGGNPERSLIQNH